MAVSQSRSSRLRQSCWWACDIGEDVPVPADKLLYDDPNEEHSRRVFCELIKLIWFDTESGSILISLEWYIVMILLDVVGIDVVSSMCALPGEVWCQQE